MTKKSFVIGIYVFLFLIGLHLLFLYKTTLFFTNNTYWIVNLYIVLTGAFLLSRFFIVYLYKDAHAEKIPNRLYPSISFVISAKNEEDSIYKTIETCMSSDYPSFYECIVVDDGSTDKTLAEMKRAQRDLVNRKGGVKVIAFPENRGKREGMAEGVLASRGEVIVFVDSDSFLEKGATKTLVEHFITDKEVGAVAGNTGVENEKFNALTKMQSARYGVSFDIFKACESVFGAVTCCPGCFSAYRKDALMPVLDKWRYQTFLGTRSTFGDDRSLTNFVLRDWKVLYCQHAKATTIVPTAYQKFLKQQLRWKKSWIREGTAAAKFIWRKNPIASFSFYTNLLIPVFSPIVAFYALVVQPVFFGRMPVIFLGGVIGLSFLFGFFNYIQVNGRYWLYVVMFTLFYIFVLVWQMPYALLKLKNTTWGTR